MKTPKKATVTKKVSPSDRLQDALDSIRWTSFIKASGLPYDQLSEDWLEFFSSQADPKTASKELVRLIDIAIQDDMEKGK